MSRRRMVVPLLLLHGFSIFTLQLLFAEPFAYEVSDSRDNKPLGHLEEMERNADLIFKGKVISSDAVTNKAFPDWGNPHATKLGVITVFKGTVDTNTLVFLHITHGPLVWGGGSPPPDFVLNPGESYVLFAAGADKSDYLYSPSSNFVAKVNEYRQLMRGIPAIRALDDRPVGGLSVKRAVWRELCGLLQNTNSASQIYAVEQLEKLSLAGRRDDWMRSDDFEREAVLKAVQPLIVNPNEMVAATAIGCFGVGGTGIGLFPDHSGWMPITQDCLGVDPKCVARVAPYADALVSVANSSTSTLGRVAAIAALSCTHFTVVSNSLPRWLSDPDAGVRAQTVLLLPDFLGEFSEHCLAERAADTSAVVRAAVADAIGNGRIETLLPTLASLFSSSPVQGDSGPWPHKGLQGDGYFAEVGADDIHSSAGYALLKFDAEQVREILKTNLWDERFGLKFIRKLAPNGAETYLPILARTLVNHTAGSEKEAATNGFHWSLSYWLDWDYGWAWDVLLSHLQTKSRESMAEPGTALLLDALQIADDPSDERTRSFYTFLLDKGLIERAKELRQGIIRRTKDPAIDRKSFNFPEKLKLFDEIDEKYSLKPGLGL